MPTQPRRSSDSRAARRAHRQPMQRRERGSRSTVFAGLIQGDTKKGRKVIGENSDKRVCTIEQVHKHGISSQKDQRAYIKPKWRIVGGRGVARCGGCMCSSAVQCTKCTQAVHLLWALSKMYGPRQIAGALYKMYAICDFSLNSIFELRPDLSVKGVSAGG